MSERGEEELGMEVFRLVSVVHVFLIKDGQVLLLQRANTGHHDGEYGLPAGKLDGGEPLHSAAIREVREECGAVIAPAELTLIGTMHLRTSGDERVDFFFSRRSSGLERFTTWSRTNAMN
ncbi:NUDIX domain-containing protein [Paenibacillus rhizoplanae]